MEYIILLWIHTFADFVLQTDDMARNKSKSNFWLGAHVFAYSLPFLVYGWEFAAVSAGMHFLVDYVSSRATSRLWAKGDRHKFFMVIGIDQALHITMLFLTYDVFFRGV